MSRQGDDFAARARALVGVRFRPQGRDPELGLDCIGVAALSAGVSLERVRTNYVMRGQHLAEIEHRLCDLGFQPVAGNRAEPGDMVVAEAGPAQLHVAVLTVGGFVHADAGLGKVVERPLPLPWPILSLWRMAGAD